MRYLCPECSKDYKPGLPLSGVLRAEFDYGFIKRHFSKKNPDFTLFSAVEKRYFPDYPVGNTPLIQSPSLSTLIGVRQLFIKYDGLNPSGSLKDRASFLMVSEANRLKEEKIVCASTGNAASALAAVCANANKRAVIFVPKTAPKAKLVQIVLYGAEIILVDGRYDDAFAMSLRYTERRGGLNRNTAYHPLTIEGKKTVSLEIFAQMNFSVPDVVVVPVGDGVIISGVYKGFYDLKMAGLIKKVPELISVQAEGSNAINRYIRSGKYEDCRVPDTIADSISVSTPSNAYMAKRAVEDSGGTTVDVSDAEIMSAQNILASKTGIFAEPAASAALAGAIKMKMELKRYKSVLLLITGNGLKDVDAPLSQIKLPHPVPKSWV
ncbi:MAG: threonine synthase [Myxococcota bacterium]